MHSLRGDFLLDPSVAYLNHGSYGATPAPVFSEYQRWQRELELQPTEFLGRRHDVLMHSARESLAVYLNAEANDLVLTQNVTIAVNIVARSLELGPGDEVLATDHEYGACDRTWRFLSKHRGFTYLHQRIDLPLQSPETVVEQFWAGVTSRTRVIFISHITSPTAIIFPVKQICARARAAGILTIVDGAHVPGQIPLDLQQLGADFYGANLHKWLCAPKGAGFLWAHPSVQGMLKPLVVSWGYEPVVGSGSRMVDDHEYWGTRDLAAFLSVPAAIRYQAEHDWAARRKACHELLAGALTDAERAASVSCYYPDDAWYAQMACLPLPAGVDAAGIKKCMYDEHRVEAPVISWNDRHLLRLSIQAYNDRSDIERMLGALKAVLS